MEWQVFHEGKFFDILHSESFLEQNLAFKRASKALVPQLALLKYNNEASFVGEHVDGFRKVLDNQGDNAEIRLKLQFVPGQTLREFRSHESSIGDKLRMCVAIAKRLAEVQRQDMVHLNLNPDHILIEKGTQRIYFISLGMAAKIRGKLGLQHRPTFPEADQDYIAPEQTGRIGASIGFYTDIYSLGAVFYWLFTGFSPFDSKDGAAKIHAHIALTPRNPAEIVDIPSILADIILKMLEKDLGNRYHSAIGVLHDLEEVMHQLESKGLAEDFELGTNDASGVLRMTDQLFGREAQFNQLLQSFHRVIEGEKVLTLVYGNSGVGKSSLVESIYGRVLSEGGLFTSGKFDQLKTDTPYAAFSQALGRLVAQLLMMNQENLAKWKEEFHRLLHPVGRVLYDVIPGLESILENEPEVPVLNGLEAQLRFNYAMNRFFQVFSGTGRPLVIFIDDLQWGDTSSFSLMRNILTSSDIQNVLLIGAYRDNEVAPGHLFLQFRSEIEEMGYQPEEIYLANLHYEDIHRLVTSSLGKSKKSLDDLVKIVDKKSGGNVLLAIQFLKAIYNSERLSFDSARGSWKWDEQELINFNVDGDIVDLFLDTIKKLPAATATLLKLASCRGNKFRVEELAIITASKTTDILVKLQPGLDLDLIIESHDGFMYFVHDRVQQAFYSLNDELGRQSYHLKIGRLLLESASDQELAENVFDIVNQLNFGRRLVTVPSDLRRVCELNIMAGIRAQNATAYAFALQYFQNAIQLLPENSWEFDRKFTYNLYLGAAIAANQCNQQELFDRFTGLLDSHTADVLEMLKLAELRILNANIANNQKKVVEVGIEALRKCDIKLKLHPSQLDVLIGFIKTNIRLSRFREGEIEKLPRINDEKTIICMSIMHHLSLAAYFLEPNLLPLLMFELIRLTLKFGLGPKSTVALVVFGYINIAFMGKIEKGLKMGQLGDRLGDILGDESQFVFNKQAYIMFIAQWLKHLADSIPDLEEAFKKGLEAGNFEFTSIIGQLIIYWYFYGGMPLDKLLRRGELLSLQIAPLNQIMQIKRIALFRQSAACLVEGVSDFDVLRGPIFNELEAGFPNVAEFGLYYHNLYAQKKLIALVFNQNEVAWKYCALEKTCLIPVKGSVTETLFYFYENICITPIFFQRSKDEQKRLLKTIKKNLKLFKSLLKYSEINYRHRYEFMNAEYENLLGNYDAAFKSYTYALRFSRQNRYIQDEAIIWERAGQFLRRQNQDEAAQFYFSNAFKTYANWGAKAKLRQMKETYHGLISTEEIGVKSNNLDLNTILKTINLISGEMVLGNILRGLMDLITENAGAERAFLIVEQDGSKIIKASLDVSKNEVKVLQEIRYDQFDEISHAVVNYVARTGEPLVLEDARTKLPYSNEAYVVQQQLKSVACMPLKHAGLAFAYLYLENRLLPGAFTDERVEIIQVMASQTAISLQNAMLLDRTTQLNQRLMEEVEVRKVAEANLRINEKRLEEYNANLESKVFARTLDLQSEKEKSDELLLNILPSDIAKELKEKGTAQAQKYGSVTVMFTDFKGFSIIAENMSADDLVSELDFCFKEFDRIIQRYGIEKIKTIGDAYMAVGGLPVVNDSHAVNVVNAALEIRDFMDQHGKKRASESKPVFEVRIGIHTGNVVAGIVGLKKFAYDIWGDTVNLAARMESSSEEGKINISGATYQLVKDYFQCHYRGKILAKNKGEVDMYFVETPKYDLASLNGLPELKKHDL